MELLKRSLLCFRTSTAVTSLYHAKCAPSSSSSSTDRESARLWAVRLVYYLLIGQLTLRGLLFSLDTSDNPLLYNPLVAFLVSRYPFLNNLLINSFCLLSCWGLFLDYAFNNSMDGALIGHTYQLMVGNGRHFRALNGRRLGWPTVLLENDGENYSWRQLWRLPAAYIALGRRIWALSSSDRKTIFNDHSAALLRFYPTKLGVVGYSEQLRGRLLVYSGALEALVILVNLSSRKW